VDLGVVGWPVRADVVLELADRPASVTASDVRSSCTMTGQKAAARVLTGGGSASRRCSCVCSSVSAR
jgi:hypothetical protein